jgi:hypothetical protein
MKVERTHHTEASTPVRVSFADQGWVAALVAMCLPLLGYTSFVCFVEPSLQHAVLCMLNAICLLFFAYSYWHARPYSANVEMLNNQLVLKSQYGTKPVQQNAIRKCVYKASPWASSFTLPQRWPLLDMHIEFASNEDAEKIAKKLDIHRQNVVLSFLEPAKIMRPMMIFICIVSTLAAIEAHAPIMPFWVAMFLLDRFVRGRVILGNDGILIKKAFEKKHLLFHEIKEITQTDQGELMFVTADKKQPPMIKLPTTLRQAKEPTFCDYLRQKLEKKDASQDTFLRYLDARERNESPVKWFSRLRELAHYQAAPFRQEKMANEDLWRIVESTSTAPWARAAAAISLKNSEKETKQQIEQTKIRFRLAAENTVEPDLQVALNAVADDDDEKAMKCVLAMRGT